MSDIYWTFCHNGEGESVQIHGKTNFINWLNDNADCDHYTFATSYKDLCKRLPFLKEDSHE